MIELPPCRHRSYERNNDGRWGCKSPKLIVPPNGVPDSTCLRCPYAEPPINEVKPSTSEIKLEAKSEPPVNETKSKKKIILKNYLSPGDVLVMEAAIASLHKTYPKVFETNVDTSVNQIYENHPNIKLLNPTEAEVIDMNYTAGINNCDKTPIHFMQGYCDMLGSHLKIRLNCVVKSPKIYISDDEKKWMNQVDELLGYKGKFWLLGASSWKLDYNIKKYYYQGIQDVVDYFRGKIQFVQVGTIGKGHESYDVEGTIDLRGKTDTRQLIRLAYWASGGLSLESFLHHLMASLTKPCVTLVSGFLPPYWIEYPTATVLSSQGCLPCFKTMPCWKSRVVKLNDETDKDKKMCELPVFLPNNDAVAKCMYMIEPEDIIKAIEKYYLGGVLTY